MNDLTFDSRYQNLHMDRANPNSMITVNININTNLASNTTPYLVYRFAHGYNYTPQFWGYWNINYGPGLLDSNGDRVSRRGYGYISWSTAAMPQANFFYTVDSTYVELYFYYEYPFVSPPRYVSGTSGTFTGYVFANDRSNQTYG